MYATEMYDYLCILFIVWPAYKLTINPLKSVWRNIITHAKKKRLSYICLQNTIRTFLLKVGKGVSKKKSLQFFFTYA